MNRPDLSGMPLFSGFSAEALALLEARLNERILEPGQSLVTAGSQADTVTIVSQGWVKLQDASGRELARSGPGSIIGEADALSEQPYGAGATALTKVTAWQLPVQAVREVVRRYPAALLSLESALGFRPAVAIRGLADWLTDMEEFHAASAQELLRIAAQLQPLPLSAGEAVPASHNTGFLVVEKGEVTVASGEDESVRNGCFLLMDWSLIGDGTPSQSVHARADTSAWYLPSEWCTRLKREGTGVFAMRPKPAASTLAAPVHADVVEIEMPAVRVDRPAPARRARGESAGTWLSSLSLGAKLRLAAIACLFAWAAVAGIATVLDASASASAGGPQRDLAPFRATSEAMSVLALAQPIVPTATFAPSPTPAPTNTAVPTDTPVPPTETPVPTETAVPTDTPEPTATRRPTNTPQAASNISNEAAAPAEATAAPPPPPPTAAPAVTWRLASWRQLTPCENQGNHTLFINVVDPSGNGVAGVPLLVEWGGGSEVIVTGNKMDKGPGWAEYPMYGGYTVRVNDGSSETTPMLSSKLPEDQRCDSTNNNVANSFGHYSYEIVFQRTS